MGLDVNNDSRKAYSAVASMQGEGPYIMAMAIKYISPNEITVSAWGKYTKNGSVAIPNIARIIQPLLGIWFANSQLDQQRMVNAIAASATIRIWSFVGSAFQLICAIGNPFPEAIKLSLL